MNVGLGQPVVCNIDGLQDLAANRSSMTMKSEVTGRLSADEPEWAAEQEIVSDGLVAYMRIQGSGSGTQKWLKYDLGAEAKREGVDLSAFMANSMGAESALRLLRSSTGARKLGQESVRGVETMHYQASIDFERALESLSHADLAAAEKAWGELESLELVFEPWDVWIDSADYVRRISYTASMNASESGGERTRFDTDVQFYDFDKPVSIELPPADQVTDLTELASDS